MSRYYKLIISNITRETNKAVSITFDVPENLKETFKFKAGQYLSIKTKINNEELRRDYSICSSRLSGELKVTVKEVEDGTFSVFANTKLKVGDTLEVAPPNGRFIFQPDALKTRTVAAFAAGSGITPIMSIAKTLFEEEPNSKFILVYGNKTPQDTIFFQEILDLHHKYLERFELHEVFSQSEKPNALFGRIEKSTVDFIVMSEYKDIDIDAFYICGPEGMIETVQQVLDEHEVEKERVFYELFKSSETGISGVNSDVNGETNIKVIVDDEEASFSMKQTDTILEATLAEDIDAPHSCKGGICSSCIARVTEGKAEMRQNNILTDSEIAEGLILTCQAQPTTVSITIDYDDV
ncbi:MAG: ferredoxin--NADP reductase [Flavobacteriaceae bacterium]|nr:ferredoxin--NADP reductase [Flavobacteriaceae bacterium]